MEAEFVETEVALSGLRFTERKRRVQCGSKSRLARDLWLQFFREKLKPKGGPVSEHPHNIEEIRERVSSGDGPSEGAAFWAYISPQNNTEECLASWSVTLQQQDGNWQGTISSDDPQQILQTPDLSGVFTVNVVASGHNFPEQRLQPLPDSQPNVGCNENCHAMVGIVANAECTGANYWTVWDAFCD